MFFRHDTFTSNKENPCQMYVSFLFFFFDTQHGRRMRHSYHDSLAVRAKNPLVCETSSRNSSVRLYHPIHQNEAARSFTTSFFSSVDISEVEAAEAVEDSISRGEKDNSEVEMYKKRTEKLTTRWTALHWEMRIKATEGKRKITAVADKTASVSAFVSGQIHICICI